MLKKVCAALAWLASVGVAWGPTAVARAKTPKPAPLQVLGFWANDDSAGLSGLYQYPRAVSTFAPFWYSVDAYGGLISHVNAAVLAKVRTQHIPMTPLVNDATGTQAFLGNIFTRVRAARAIADMVKANHFQGVDIDFEPPHTYRVNELTAFMIDLHDFMPRGSDITLAIVPHSGGAYDYGKLAPEINQFVLMSYDEHDDGSPPGPVAAIGWVQNLVARLKRVVPSQKILLGIPAYGYLWRAGSTAAVTVPYNAVTPLMNRYAQWDSADQETYAVFDTASGPMVAWWESLQGMNEKIQVAKRDHLAGIAIWHLGYANNAVYQLLLHQIGPHSAQG